MIVWRTRTHHHHCVLHHLARWVERARVVWHRCGSGHPERLCYICPYTAWGNGRDRRAARPLPHTYRPSHPYWLPRMGVGGSLWQLSERCCGTTGHAIIHTITPFRSSIHNRSTSQLETCNAMDGTGTRNWIRCNPAALPLLHPHDRLVPLKRYGR